jgi:hypothetical protein
MLFEGHEAGTPHRTLLSYGVLSPNNGNLGRFNVG